MSISFDDLFATMHERDRTRLAAAEKKFFERKESGGWNNAIQWSAETVLVLEAKVTIMDRAVAAAERNPEGQTLRGALTHQTEGYLNNVWGLSRSTSPFGNLAEDAYKVASADLKRTFEDVE